MRGIGFIAGTAFWAAALAVSPNLAAAAEADDPLSIVRNIYLQYAEDGEVIDVPAEYFTASLRDLWRKVEAGDENSVEGALGFPVFNNEGEDETIAIDDVRFDTIADRYVVASYIVLVEDDASIKVTRTYFQYNFKDTDDGWKIDNIDWGRHKKTLRQYLTEINALRALQ